VKSSSFETAPRGLHQERNPIEEKKKRNLMSFSLKQGDLMAKTSFSVVCPFHTRMPLCFHFPIPFATAAYIRIRNQGLHGSDLSLSPLWKLNKVMPIIGSLYSLRSCVIPATINYVCLPRTSPLIYSVADTGSGKQLRRVLVAQLRLGWPIGSGPSLVHYGKWWASVNFKQLHPLRTWHVYMCHCMNIRLPVEWRVAQG
jgi:hypothetical protein